MLIGTLVPGMLLSMPGITVSGSHLQSNINNKMIQEAYAQYGDYKYDEYKKKPHDRYGYDDYKKPHDRYGYDDYKKPHDRYGYDDYKKPHDRYGYDDYKKPHDVYKKDQYADYTYADYKKKKTS